MTFVEDLAHTFGMDVDARREILTAVAEGRMRPEEAAERLAGLGGAREGERPGNGEHTEEGPIRRVRVQGTFRHARIIGDPEVREAVAEGPHAARREGDTLVIESEQDLPGFAFHYGHRGRRGGLPFAFGDFAPAWWWPGQDRSHLTVRMRPDLPLAVDLTAGRVGVEGLRGPLQVQVAAGGADLRSFRGPLDIRLTAGSVRATGVLATGHSRVRCEAGSVKLHLEDGSDVRIRTRAEFGRVSLPARPPRSEDRWLAGGVTEETTIGKGTATLEVEVTMGDVAVTAA